MGGLPRLPSPCLLRRPEAQVAEDLADDCRIVDEGDHAHGALAPRAFERIVFVDLVNQARPGGAHARGFANIGRSRRGMVNTYCRCGTGASTLASTHSPYASTLFWWQLGQKYLALHEKARMKPCRQWSQ